ncbi:hypothetical protein GCM10020254_12490 [Streptomyces goshikiensis]
MTTTYTPTNHSGWTTSFAPVRSVTSGTPAAYSTGAASAHTTVTPSTGRPSRTIRPFSQAAADPWRRW